VSIQRETINLGQLLKLEGLIGSGAEAKMFLATELRVISDERRGSYVDTCRPARAGLPQGARQSGQSHHGRVDPPAEERGRARPAEADERVDPIDGEDYCGKGQRPSRTCTTRGAVYHCSSRGHNVTHPIPR
jgi:hypothetical protein